MPEPPTTSLSFSGVLPRLAVSAELHGPRSESGIGALMPWGGRLWFVTYVSHKRGSGSGTGLYYIDEDLVLHKHPESVVGTYANRLVHVPSEQMIIGPHVIDTDLNVRTIESLEDVRLTATLTHLTDPEHKVYMLGMESEFFEVDLRDLSVRQLFCLNDDLALPAGRRAHYKGGFTALDRVIVGNNTYSEQDHVSGESTGGRLAEWDGNGPWRILESTAFCDINGRRAAEHAHAMAIGWDRASVLLNVLVDGVWTRYRLPKASHCYDHAWYTEWPRIREIETERYLMDMHGLFYELTPLAYGGRIWGVKPIAQHHRMVADFCSWRGLLVLAGNQNSACSDNLLCGEPEANLWFGMTDDLWSFGKPQGWGGPWWETSVTAGEASDPYLMTGFEHKCLHLSQRGDGPLGISIEVDFRGDGHWHTFDTVRVPADGYAPYVFPTGFSAHWVRLVADRPTVVTAQLVYT